MQTQARGPTKNSIEWWIKRIKDPVERQQILDSSYYKENKGMQQDSIFQALNYAISSSDLIALRQKYFGKSCTQWQDNPPELLPEPVEEGKVQISDYTVGAIKGQKVAVHCKTQDEWDTCLAIYKGTRLKNTEWATYKTETVMIVDDYKGCFGDTDYCNRNNYQIITGAQFLAANGQPVEHQYAVGEYVTCIPGKGQGSGWKKDKTFKIAKIINEQHKDYGNTLWPTDDGKSSGVWSDSVRYATLAEIDAIQGTGWQVGEKLPVEWIKKQVVYDGDDCKKVYNQDLSVWGTADRVVEEVRNGYAYISGTYHLWLAPKNQQQPVVSTPSLGNIGWQIGDIIHHNTDEDHTWVIESDGKGGIQSRVHNTGGIDKESVADVNHLISTGIWIVKRSTSSSAPIPVTAENVFIGMRVVATSQLAKQYTWHTDNGTNTGTIVQIKGGLMTVDWDNHGKLYHYTTDLLVAPTEQQVSNQVNNQSSNQTKTTEHEHKSKCIEGTAVNLPANPSTVCRADRRTTTPVRQSGQPLSTVRGYRSNSKGLRLI